MFNAEFFPTPVDVIDLMMYGEDVQGKTILEPSAGKGDIIDYLIESGAADVLACEINENLQTILKTKAKLIGEDFLTLTSDKISHIDTIVMNPPFSNADKHILHAYEIAPAGCRIIALCNLQTVRNPTYKSREQLCSIIEECGHYTDIGQAFKDAERETGVNVALIKITKAGENYKSEFEGFFTDETEEQQTGEGIMQYNSVRDLVNRYVEAVKLFDKQIEDGIKMNSLVKTFYMGKICFECTEDAKAKTRQEFKADLQREGWRYIFSKMNMDKYSTRGVRDDINKFIQQQKDIPFTMKNIYRMFEIVIGTAGQRMDKAIIDVFDKLTEHHSDNRYNVEGWKTNSHYLLTKRFILPRMCEVDKWHKGNRLATNYGSYFDLIDDFMKALCYVSGDNYDTFGSLDSHIRYPYTVTTPTKVEYFHDSIHYSGAEHRKKELTEKGIPCTLEMHELPEYGKWFEWGYFKIKAHKKGTMHFEFKDEDLWARLNQRISKIKGYPLYEAKPQTAYQNKQTGRKDPIRKANPTENILFKINL